MGKLSCLNFPVTIDGMDGQTLGESIRVAREAAGMSQGALAKEVGASLRAVGGWERGEVTPTGRNLARLREVLPGWAEPPARGYVQIPRIRWEDQPPSLEEVFYLVENAEAVLSRALDGGMQGVVDGANSGALMGAVISARHLLNQAVHGLRERGPVKQSDVVEVEEIDAQAPEPKQGTGSSAGGSPRGAGASIGAAGKQSEVPERDPIPDHLSGESTRSAQ